MVYCATSSESVLISASDRPLLKQSVTIVDIGLPRNVDPEIANESGVSLVNLDTLQAVVDTTLKNRKKDSQKITSIIEETIQNLNLWKQYRSEVVSA